MPAHLTVDSFTLKKNLEWGKKVSPNKEVTVTLETCGDSLHVIFSSPTALVFTRQIADIDEDLPPVSMSLDEAKPLLSLEGENVEISLEGEGLVFQGDSTYTATVSPGVSEKWCEVSNDATILSVADINSYKSALRKNIGLRSQPGAETFSLLLLSKKDDTLSMMVSNRFTVVNVSIPAEGALDSWKLAIPEAPFFSALPSAKNAVINVQRSSEGLLLKQSEDAVVHIFSSDSAPHEMYQQAMEKLKPTGEKICLGVKEVKSSLDAMKKVNPNRVTLKISDGRAELTSERLVMPLRSYDGAASNQVHHFNPDSLRRALEGAKGDMLHLVLPSTQEPRRTAFFSENNNRITLDVLTAAQNPQ